MKNLALGSKKVPHFISCIHTLYTYMYLTLKHRKIRDIKRNICFKKRKMQVKMTQRIIHAFQLLCHIYSTLLLNFLYFFAFTKI